MLFSFQQNLSILPEELLTFMVYMGVEVMAWSGIYGEV
jgi:hypothetical protein